MFETRRRGYETEVKALEDLVSYLRSDMAAIANRLKIKTSRLRSRAGNPMVCRFLPRRACQRLSNAQRGAQCRSA